MKSKKKKLYPMPIEGLLACWTWQNLPFSILARLVLWFWQNGCPKELPKRQLDVVNQLYIHSPVWIKYRVQVLEAFEKIRPELEAYWQLRENKLTAINYGAAKSVATRARLRLQANAEIRRAGVVLPSPKKDAANQAAAVEGRKVGGDQGFID